MTQAFTLEKYEVLMILKKHLQEEHPRTKDLVVSIEMSETTVIVTFKPQPPRYRDD